MYTEKYGPDPAQEGDLFIPDQKPRAILCLFHGGFWTMPYGRDQLIPVARDLAHNDFIIWNIGCRRIGGGGGWPATFDDVVAAINHLRILSSKFGPFDLTKVVPMGHSAGGQLAIWAGKHYRDRIDPSIRLDRIVGLAPVVDLTRTYDRQLGAHSVFHLLGGSPEEYPDRYASADPMKMMPLKVPQLLLHGNADEALPVEWSRDYVNAARTAGENIEYIEIENGGHMDYIDPNSKAIFILREWLVNTYKAADR